MRQTEQPSPQEQKQYMAERLDELKYDFMPKEKNKVYHVVSTEWFKQWKTYVGLSEETPKPEDGP